MLHDALMSTLTEGQHTDFFRTTLIYFLAREPKNNQGVV